MPLPLLPLLIPWIGAGALGTLGYYLYKKGGTTADAIQAKAKMNAAYGHVKTLAARVSGAKSGGVPPDIFARASALKDEVDAINALSGSMFVSEDQKAAARADLATKEAYVVAGKLAAVLGEQNPVEAPTGDMTTLLVLGGIGVAGYFTYKWLTNKHGDTIPKNQLPRYAGGRRK